MTRFWKSFLVICVLAAGAGFYWWKSQPATKTADAVPGKAAKAQGKGAGRRGGGPVPVRTVSVTRQAMPVIIDAVGTVESEHSVAVRPQVGGVLQEVKFKEGDRVKQGQVLFHIDARPMQAAVEQVRAALARDQAQLVQAKAQEARLRPLMEKDYITRQEYDVAATQAKSLEATVDANRASLEQAQLQLAYAQISAPISGRTGSLSVRAGNLVTAGTGGAPLVVINSTQPILVSLSVPQRHLDDVRRHWNSPELKVEVTPDRGGQTVAHGTLVFIDNTVNPTTGTIVLKARVKNEKEELWPGQFVSARIVLRIEKEAVVLPEGTVQPGQDGPFVFVVKDGRAQIQNVVVDRQIGELVVVSKGLTGSEEIIAEVPPTLTVGTPVTIGGERGKGGERKGGERKGDKSQESPATQTPNQETPGKNIPGKKVKS